jgi:hypothetical protein
MRQADYQRALRQMERLREDLGECEPKDVKRIEAEYAALARSIRPFALGEKQLTD